MKPKFLEDYVGVDELVSQSVKDYPNSRLVSEIVYFGDDYVVFKTSFYEDKTDESPKAVSHAKQTVKDHSHWFEMAETKSVGRCLRKVYGSEPTREEMQGIVPQKNEKVPEKPQKQGVKYKYEGYPNEKGEKSSLDKKVEELEKEGLVEDISDKAKALQNSIKNYALEATNQDLDKARDVTVQAMGQLGLSKSDININNLQSIKNEIQDIITKDRANIDKGE